SDLIAEVEGFLTHGVEDRRDLLLRLGRTRSANPQTLRCGGIGTAKHRRRYIDTSVLRMILRQLARGRGRDGAHRDVDAAGCEAMRDGIDANYDRVESSIIGKHRDDDAAGRRDRR